MSTNQKVEPGEMNLVESWSYYSSCVSSNGHSAGVIPLTTHRFLSILLESQHCVLRHFMSP